VLGLDCWSRSVCLLFCTVGVRGVQVVGLQQEEGMLEWMFGNLACAVEG